MLMLSFLQYRQNILLLLRDLLGIMGPYGYYSFFCDPKVCF